MRSAVRQARLNISPQLTALANPATNPTDAVGGASYPTYNQCIPATIPPTQSVVLHIRSTTASFPADNPTDIVGGTSYPTYHGQLSRDNTTDVVGGDFILDLPRPTLPRTIPPTQSVVLHTRPTTANLAADNPTDAVGGDFILDLNLPARGFNPSDVVDGLFISVDSVNHPPTALVGLFR